jgi:uncharacterized membrane protein
MFRMSIPRQIVIVSLLAIGLDVVRVALSGSMYFLYLLWNLLLALLPFVVSSALLWYSTRNKVYPALLIIGGAMWLFLFPNAPYLVTDMIHLKENHLLPLWYDAMLLFSFAWAGMLLALHSLSHIEKTLRHYFSRNMTWVVFSLAVLLSSYGIYLGRLLRFNSWDVFLNPGDLVATVVSTVTQPSLYSQGYLITIVFFIFIMISYFAWRPEDITAHNDHTHENKA